MGTDKKEQLEIAMGKVKKTDKVRSVLLIVCLVFLLFIFFGNKAWEGQAWYQDVRGIVFGIAGTLVSALVIVTFVKLFFVIKYNNIIKKG